MSVQSFNLAMFAGWLLVLVGGVCIHPAAGLAVAGLLLIALTLLAVRLGGGLYAPSQRALRPAAEEDPA